MAIPDLVRGRLHRVEALIGAAAVTLEKRVNTPIDLQWGKRWCWACVGAGVQSIVTAQPSIAQCSVAAIHLEHEDCCDFQPPVKPPSTCDVEAALDEVFVDLKVASTNGQGTLPIKDVRDEIDRKRPVACAIRFPNSYHFVVVDGYMRSGTNTTFIIRDSERGEIRMSYTSLVSNYNDEGGTWEWWYRIA